MAATALLGGTADYTAPLRSRGDPRLKSVGSLTWSHAEPAQFALLPAKEGNIDWIRRRGAINVGNRLRDEKDENVFRRGSRPV